MSNTVMPMESPAGAIVPVDTAERARAYIDAATAANTRRAYRSDWADFAAWCAAHGLPTLPADPETVALYLAALAQVAKVSTVQRRLTAIAKAHRAGGYETPTRSEAVHLTMRGIRRTHGVAPTQKAPAVLADLRAMLATCPYNLIGIRDRAILLLGFAGAFRRSELVSLDVTDLAFGEDGLTITLRRSKGDQGGEGVKKGIPFGYVTYHRWAALPPGESPRPDREGPARG
jgi:site-specific recombinase XerD